MAEENEDGQEKTEEPSQRKIDKHKEDGKVLSSKEMFVFTGIAGALLLMYAFSFSFKTILVFLKFWNKAITMILSIGRVSSNKVFPNAFAHLS